MPVGPSLEAGPGRARTVRIDAARAARGLRHPRRRVRARRARAVRRGFVETLARRPDVSGSDRRVDPPVEDFGYASAGRSVLRRPFARAQCARGRARRGRDAPRGVRFGRHPTADSELARTGGIRLSN